MMIMYRDFLPITIVDTEIRKGDRTNAGLVVTLDNPSSAGGGERPVKRYCMITERAVNFLGWGCLTPPPHRLAIGVGGENPYI
ncbi:hypothetical protein [Limnospira sp. PMC 894.15]|uniref:hypothetical protein n=1 Tax=Limnospira sp. PMC 894.15 TaxID=2981100 RepID=UPI0037C14F50